MKKQNLDKISKSIREAIDEFESKSIFELKPEQKRKLNVMADDIETIASASDSINDSLPKLAAKLEKQMKLEAMRQTKIEEEKLIAEAHLAYDEIIAFSKKHADDPKLHPYFRDQHKTAYDRSVKLRDEWIKGIRATVNVRARMEKTLKSFESFGIIVYAVMAIRTLRDIQSQNWLLSVQANMLKEHAREAVKELKEQNKGSLPARLENLLIEILNVPSDLLGGLTKLLELRKKLDRLELDSEADLKAALGLADQIHKTAITLKSVAENLHQILSL